jgi:hypothetical protein
VARVLCVLRHLTYVLVSVLPKSGRRCIHHNVSWSVAGVSLGRRGEVCTLQLCGRGQATVYIVDVCTLGPAAFQQGERLGRGPGELVPL